MHTLISTVASYWDSFRPHQERGSVTMENVIWALAVIVIAGIVVAAITAYVTTNSSLLGT